MFKYPNFEIILELSIFFILFTEKDRISKEQLIFKEKTDKIVKSS